MRLEQQRIGVLFVALLLGGSISLSLFVFMVFLIEPEKSISHMPGPYMVTFVDIKDKNKAKKKPGKKMEMPKVPAIPGLTPVKPQVPQKARNRRISVRFPTIGSIDVYSSGSGSALDLNLGTEEHYSSKDNRKVLFNQVEGKYAHVKKEKELLPERVRIAGGGEIDRIGDTCFEVPGSGASGGGDTGQSAVEEDENGALRSLYARQVPCNEMNNSAARDFLKQLKKRGLILAPVSLTH